MNLAKYDINCFYRLFSQNYRCLGQLDYNPKMLIIMNKSYGKNVFLKLNWINCKSRHIRYRKGKKFLIFFKRGMPLCYIVWSQNLAIFSSKLDHICMRIGVDYIKHFWKTLINHMSPMSLRRQSDAIQSEILKNNCKPS